MSLVINNETISKGWYFTEDGWKLSGDSQHASNGTLLNFSAQVYKVVDGKDVYDGRVNGYRSEDEMKLNMSEIPFSDVADVSVVVGDLIEALGNAE